MVTSLSVATGLPRPTSFVAISLSGPGDVIWFAPGEKHWHGASATTAMTHIAIQEQLDGKAADWMEKVSDEQYQAFSDPQHAGNRR